MCYWFLEYVYLGFCCSHRQYAFLFDFMGGWYGKYSPREVVHFVAAWRNAVNFERNGQMQDLDNIMVGML